MPSHCCVILVSSISCTDSCELQMKMTQPMRVESISDMQLQIMGSPINSVSDRLMGHYCSIVLSCGVFVATYSRQFRLFHQHTEEQNRPAGTTKATQPLSVSLVVCQSSFTVRRAFAETYFRHLHSTVQPGLYSALDPLHDSPLMLLCAGRLQRRTSASFSPPPAAVA
jgi:hypothetical protein